MTPLPLAEIGLRPSQHRAALWWLGLLYRRPMRFREALAGLPWHRALLAGVTLYLHALPWMFIFTVTSQLALTGWVEWHEPPPAGIWEPVLFHATQASVGIAVGIASGITFGIAWGIVGIAFGIAVGIAVLAREIALAIAVGIASGIAVGITFGIAVGIASEIASGITFGIAVGIAAGIAGGIALGIAGITGIAVGIAGIALGIAGIALGIAFGIAVGIASGIVFGIAGIAITRLYYHPLHLCFVWPTVKGNWYPYHPVAWDDLCGVPFPALDRLLIAYAEYAPEAGAREIERVINDYPSQRWAALRARVRLIAREAGQETDLARLDEIVAQLPEGEKDFLAETRRLKELVSEISQLQRRLDTQDRPFLRESTALLLCKTIETFRYPVSGFREPLVSEFRAAAARWAEIAARQLEEAQALLARAPTPQVFRAGDPVDREREAFVYRNQVIGELEQQIMLATGCPGLILYGRRRVGKSTVLRNLAGFLLPAVRIAVVSMQDAKAFTSTESLIQLLDAAIRREWPQGEPSPKPATDLPGLAALLAACNDGLERQGQDRRLLVALDEYEYLDHKFGEGVFGEDLLAVLRESIQSHRQLIWVFAGSHHIAELTHAPWPSYLVSVRTVRVSMFTEAETRLLLTDPLHHSSLWRDREAERPRFEPGFWGEYGIERLHTEAGGWPHLVQLLAETTVNLLNREGIHQVDTRLLEQACDKAVEYGDTVLREIVERECRLPGEWEYLCGFRHRDLQPFPDNDEIYRSLKRRELVTEANGEWRLRVPLMQRWLRQGG